MAKKFQNKVRFIAISEFGIVIQWYMPQDSNMSLWPEYARNHLLDHLETGIEWDVLVGYKEDWRRKTFEYLYYKIYFTSGYIFDRRLFIKRVRAVKQVFNSAVYENKTINEMIEYINALPKEKPWLYLEDLLQGNVLLTTEQHFRHRMKQK